MEAVAKINLSGSTQITVEGIKKHFQSYEPFQCLIECIWNGYDANANHLSVKINKNGLDGLENVLIVDDGDGVDVHDLSNSFGKFNESQKKLDDNKHGSQGKGRLSFHRLCDQATWFTKSANINARIDISSRSIKDYNCIEIDSKEQHVSLKEFPSGTCVELSEFSSNELPSEQSLLNIFSDEFGWFLALYPHVSLEINKNFVQVPECQIRETEFDIDGYAFKVKVIRWVKRPSSEKSYNYLISSRSRIVKKDLSVRSKTN